MTNGNLKTIMEYSVAHLINDAQYILDQMSIGEIDKILTLVYTKDQKDFIDSFCTIISINYPNELGYQNIYFCGGQLFKIAISNEPI